MSWFFLCNTFIALLVNLTNADVIPVWLYAAVWFMR